MKIVNFIYQDIIINGQFSNGSTKDWFYNFTKVWDGYIYDFSVELGKSVLRNSTYDESIDVDHLIKDMLVGNSITILTKDDRILASGRHGYVGFDIPFDNRLKFTQYPISVKEGMNFSTNVYGIYASSGSGSQIIWRKNEGKDELFGARNSTNEIIGISIENAEQGYFYKLPLQEEIIEDGIKDLALTNSCTYILTNSGNVYATGKNAGLGLGSENTANVNQGYIQLDIEKKVIAINEYLHGNNTTYCILTLEDGTYLGIGDSQIILRNNILQNSSYYFVSNENKALDNLINKVSNIDITKPVTILDKVFAYQAFELCPSCCSP